MPEGPEIRRAADTLISAVQGKILTHVWFAFPQLKRYESLLTGKTITAIETRGKALLIHFSNALSMYSHNQLYGVWKVAKSGERPQTKRDLRVALETVDRAILLYSASDIEVGSTETIARHPFLQRIGPDVLDRHLTEADVLKRLVDRAFCRKQLGSLLLDQRFLAGLGNYLRAEILWHAQLLPGHKPQDLTPEQLSRLAQALLFIPRLSYETRGEVNPDHHHGALFSFRVFGRAGKACERCGEEIKKIALSSRPFFYCIHCQK